MITNRIVFIGAGNMAEAILRSVKEKYTGIEMFAYDISDERLAYMHETYDINVSSKDYDFREDDIIFLSIKPKDAKSVCQSIKNKLSSKNIIVSIMAGININFLEENFSGDVKVVRVMPNTPALVGEAMAVITYNTKVVDAEKKNIESVLGCLGETAVLSEDKFDAVTALSGSGPAYIFYLAESMIKAGIDMGLDESVSKKLAIQTIYGSAKMLKHDDDATKLREKVTSKGGTTQAAITFMDENKCSEIIKTAIQKAKQRSIELGKE